MTRILTFSHLLAIGGFLLVHASHAQIKVVDMIPGYQSNEKGQDAEPNLAVNPAHPLQMVATAFTPNTSGHDIYYSPLYVSSDGGDSWEYRNVIPGNVPYRGTSDITIRFAGVSNKVYVGMLQGDERLYSMHILSLGDFNSPDPAVNLFSRNNVDQPYIQAATLIQDGQPSSDRIYVGNSNKFKNAAVDFSFDASETPTEVHLEEVDKPFGGTDEPGVRTAIHPSGVIYTVFYKIWHQGSVVDSVSVRVVRDNQWAKGTKRFEDLKQPITEAIGQFVADGVLIPARDPAGRSCPIASNCLGSNRLGGSHLSIAVDPNDAAVVYVAWADYVITVSSDTVYTLHVKKSIDSGQSWPNPDLITIPNAVNPALAVNTNSKVAFLYQQMIKSDTSWETHLRRSTLGDNVWSDDVLSTFHEKSMPRNLHNVVYLGDYLHMIAVGKDFYGVFSASNDPDRTKATFPSGVTYQRNLDAASTELVDDDGNHVDPSVDPFFFHVTELGPSEDFYVRDFTESPTYYDEGLEPSTSPRFCITSDIWNRRSNTPGPYGNNGPSSAAPRLTGNNFIFTRVRRKGPAPAGSADKTVNINYYYAQFGTGNNFVPIGSSTLSFSPSESDKTTSGIHWSLPTGSSNHVCLGVEISTDKDPLIGTSLDQHVPGWNTGTDLLVINDNNMAQRNMHIYIAPDPPEMSMPATAVMYALIHNPALETTDIQLETVIDPLAKVRPSVACIGSKGEFSVNKLNGFVLHNVKPGESRFLKISYPVPPGKTGKSFSLTFNEIKNGVRVNAFTILNKYFSIDETIKENLRFDVLIFTRVNALYKATNAASLVKKIDENELEKNISSEAYLNYLKENLPVMKSVIRELVSIGKGDSFGLLRAANILDEQLKYKNVIKIANAHLSFLNTIDACLTSRQLEKGNIADILQTMYLQRDMLQKINSKHNENIADLLDQSNSVIEQFEKREISISDYPAKVKSMLTDLRTCSAKLGNDDARLSEYLNTMEQMNDPVELQGAHIKFLLVLKELLRLK